MEHPKHKEVKCCSGHFQLIFLGLASTTLADGALAKAKSFPPHSQVAVRRRTSAWTRTRTRWRRQRRVPAMSFSPSPMATGQLASSRARQLPAHRKVGPGIGRLRSVAKVWATKPWPALTSRDAWWIRPSVRKPVSVSSTCSKQGLFELSDVSKWKMLPWK